MKLSHLSVQFSSCMSTALCKTIQLCKTCIYRNNFLSYNHISTVPGKTLQSPEIWCPILFLCFNFHPQSSRLGMSCTQFTDWPQTWSLIYATFLYVWTTLPWLVEWHHTGVASGQTFQNVLCSRQTLSYMMTTKASIRSMSWSQMEAVVSFKRTNLSVTSSKISHACHVVRIPFPRKDDTVSQPVSAWQNGKPNTRGYLISHELVSIWNVCLY